MSQDRSQPNNLGAHRAGFIKRDTVMPGHQRGDTIGKAWEGSEPQPSTSRSEPEAGGPALLGTVEETLGPYLALCSLSGDLKVNFWVQRNEAITFDFGLF